MNIGDIIGVVFFLLIVGSFVAPWVRGLLPDGRRGTHMRTGGGPKSFAESGGYRTSPRPSTSRPTTQNAAPLLDTWRGSLEDRQEAPLSLRADARATREEALERGPSAGSQTTSEERTRRQLAPAQVQPPRHTPDRRRIGRQFVDPASVRMAFIMKEVLDRPAGMRDEP